MNTIHSYTFIGGPLILISHTGGRVEYWLHPLHLACGQAPLRDADLEGYLLQDQEE